VRRYGVHLAAVEVTLDIPEDILETAGRLAQQAGLDLSTYTARLMRQAAVAEALDILHADGPLPVDDDLLDEAEQVWREME
jgi:hypothetical protein